jgi:hypothetical protein
MSKVFKITPKRVKRTNINNRNNIIAHKQPILQWGKGNKGSIFADICF